MISTIILVLLLLLSSMSFLPGFRGFINNTLRMRPDSDNRAGSSGQGDSTSSANDSDQSQPKTPTSHGYEPSALDVVVTKAMLTNGLNLPTEIVLAVLDHAEYWPHNTTKLDHSLTVTSGPDRENQFVLRSRPLGLIKKVHYDDHYYSFTAPQPKSRSDHSDYSVSQFQEWIGGPTHALEHPCRKIVFTMRSRDQGWGGHHEDRGTYRGSWTWFEAGLERFDKNATHPKDSPEKEAPAEGAVTDEAGSASTGDPKDVIPKPYFPVYAARSIHPAVEPDREAFHQDLHPSPHLTIQRNRAATRQPTTHKVVWSWKDNENPLTADQLEGLGRGSETGTGDFVRNLRLGDVLTVWAKARFAGWTNHVESVQVDVYWAL